MKNNKFYREGVIKTSPEPKTKVMVEIEIPTSWMKSPNKEYEEIQDKIKSRWALVSYLTGMKAEDWVGKNDHGYKELGAVGFIDASSAVEDAIYTLVERRIKGITDIK